MAWIRTCAVVAALLAAVLLGACGGGDETTETQTSNASSQIWEKRQAKAVETYMREHYRKAAWFSNITEINVSSGVAVVFMSFEPEPALDHRYGVRICDAVLTSNMVKRAVVFWARRLTVDCENEDQKLS
ncbi:MAG TPA: hypothetical protein VI039_04870 [Solirubrobacterales bacterium]